MLDSLQTILDKIFTYRDTIAIVALIITIIVFIIQQRQSNRIERQENYLTLELASNDLFKFEGENAQALMPFQEETLPTDAHMAQHQGLANAFYFMTLNLFEASIRFRKNKTIDKTVFGSWVIWYYDTLGSRYFRAQWSELRDNYTQELKDIFDKPVADYSTEETDRERKVQFFNHVAEILNCPIIRDWLDTPPQKTRSTLEKASQMRQDIKVDWQNMTPDLAQTLGAFFTDNIKGHPEYISHSEYFEGFSPDGKIWVTDLKRRLTEGMMEPRTDHPLNVLILWQGTNMSAVALIDWDSNGVEDFGIIEDMAVSKSARRQGLGQRLMDEIQKRAKEKNVKKLILESGLSNHGAHALFSDNGFQLFSKVFIKNLHD